jgi:hypothetical protein
MSDYSVMAKIKTGTWRDEMAGPMQVVSGAAAHAGESRWDVSSFRL